METIQELAQNKYTLLISKIKSVRLKEMSLQLMEGFLFWAAISLLFVSIASIVEYFANGDVTFRTSLFIVCGVGSLFALAYFFVPSALRLLGIRGYMSVNQIALRIGAVYPEVRDKLANAIQLIDRKEKNIGSSQTLINAVIDNVYDETKELNFAVIIQKRRTNFAMLFCIFAIFGFLAVNNIAGLSQAYHRLTHFSEAFIPPAPFTLKLETTDLTLLRGSRAEILFSSKGQAPDYINIYVKEEGQKNYNDFRLKKDKNNKYKYEIASVKQSMEFYGATQWITSSIVTDVGILKIIDIPNIRSLSGKLNFPYYTHQQPREISEMSADITALIGANADLTITSNKKIKNAYIVFEKTKIVLDDTMKQTDTFHIGMKINNNKMSGNLRITQNGFYYFVIEDYDGLKNINPIKYSVVALSDGAPSISLLYPTTDVQVTEQALLPMKLTISDDYGFSSLKLYYRLAASKFTHPDVNFNSLPIKITSNELAQEISYIWDMNKINIVPEDIFEFYIEVADNDVIGEYKKARTQMLKVRLPSLVEVAKQAEDAQNQANKDLSNINKEAKQLKKNIEDLQREVTKNKDKELDWKQKKQLQDIVQKQKNLEDKLQDVSEQLGETTKQLQENNMLSQETMQKYQELQKLLNEVKSPELERMRQMTQDQLNKMTPKELRKAMEQAKFDEERFNKMIERTMEILKRMKAEQKMDALARYAEELQKKQDELNNEMNNTNDQNKLNDLANKQEQLKQELKELSQEMKSLENLMKEIGENEMPMQEMKDAMNTLENDNIDKDMQDASDEMQKGDKSDANKSQKSASKKLQKLAQQMKKMKSEMQNKNSKEVVRKFQKAIDNLAKISKQQENTKNNTKRSNNNSTRIPDIAKEQANIFENLYNTGSDLMEIAGKTFSITQEMVNDINEGLKNMRDGMEQLTERRLANAANKQTAAMKNINSTMMQMQDALQQMKNGQQSSGSCDNPNGSGEGQSQGQGQGGMLPGGIGFSQRMQQMAAQQQALNQQMQDMMNGQNGNNQGQYSQEQRAEMKRLAEQQDKMRKSVDEMGKEQKELGGKPQDKTDGDKLANELKKLSEEMKEITSDIKNGNISPETLQRQERILSRMLDATRSVNERDFEKTRESKTGIAQSLRSPAEIDLTTQEGKTRAMQQLLNSIKQGYTKDYEQVIRQYLEAIQNNY
jgi:flagellar biosynthesis GTPase FlhF